MSDAHAATEPQKTTKVAPLRRVGDSHISCWRSGANVRDTA